MHTAETSKQRPAPWWQGAVFYQIYPRSFLDTNDDGVGDLRGITRKIDYIADLGVDAIWISPFFKSPMTDFGYDVSDYRDIDPLFGTLADFDTLLNTAHGRGIKIIVDLVLSHTSDQHPWFQDSRQSHENPFADWYVWADPKPDGGPPNNWVSVFGGPAWTLDPARGQYYLHNFLPSQPDLNFHNPLVQNAALDIARFWLDRGVDGFRLDVVNFYFHDRALRDNPPRDPQLGAATQYEGEDPYSAQAHIHDKSQPENLIFLERLRALMDSYPDRFTIGEIGDDNPYERTAEYTSNGRLNTCYNTQMMSGQHKSLSPAMIRQPLEKALHYGGWPSWAFSNHDVVRAASRWLSSDYRASSQPLGFDHDPDFSKMLLALLACLYGTVFIYQGEELGLPEAKLAFEDLQDPWGKNLWPHWQGRDGCRTPIPWDSQQDFAGFSTSRPWLPIHDGHTVLSIADQENNPQSCLNFCRRLLHWRKDHPVLAHGQIQFLMKDHPAILAFKRVRGPTNILCLFNLSSDTKTIEAQEGSILFHRDLEKTLPTGANVQYVLGPYGFGIIDI